MITYPCPKCDSRLDVPSDAAGRPIECPDCGAESIVPGPLPSRRPSASPRATAPVLTPKSVTTPTVRSPFPARQPEPADIPSEEDDDPIAARREELKSRTRFRMTVLLASAVIAVVAAMGTATFFMLKYKQQQREAAQIAERARADAAKAERSKSQPLPQPSPKFDGPNPNRPIPNENPSPKSRVVPNPTTPIPAQPDEIDLKPVLPPDPVLPKPAPPVPFVSDRPKKEVFDGYFQRSPSGFKYVYVSRLAYENSDEADGEPLKIIDDQLERIADVFDPINLALFKKVPIWVEWNHAILDRGKNDRHAIAAYYPQQDRATLVNEGIDPRKSKCISMVSLKTAVKLKGDGINQNWLIHEFAHVYHDQFAPGGGSANPFVIAAYDQAMARELYGEVRFDNGKFGVAYAAQSYKEYFAELTCAYLDKLDYEPHDRKELKEYDSVGYELMTKAWGTPEQIAERRKKALEKKSPKK